MPETLSNRLRRKLGLLIKGSDYSIASLGRAIGDKDHLRDFLQNRKESLKPEAILKIEQLLRIPSGFLLSEDDDLPDAPALKASQAPTATVDAETLLAIIRDTVDLALDFLEPREESEPLDDARNDVRGALIRRALAAQLDRLSLSPPRGSERRRPVVSRQAHSSAHSNPRDYDPSS
jgi:hypothetical protein